MGGGKDLHLDVRLISSCNEDPFKAISENTFRRGAKEQAFNKGLGNGGAVDGQKLSGPAAAGPVDALGKDFFAPCWSCRPYGSTSRTWRS